MVFYDEKVLSGLDSFHPYGLFWVSDCLTLLEGSSISYKNSGCLGSNYIKNVQLAFKIT